MLLKKQHRRLFINGKHRLRTIVTHGEIIDIPINVLGDDLYFAAPRIWGAVFYFSNSCNGASDVPAY